MNQDGFRDLLSVPRPAHSAITTNARPASSKIKKKEAAPAPTSSFVPDPTIGPPVKGLDLEAIERARARVTEEDVDDLLEQTYKSKPDASSGPSTNVDPLLGASKKRTREEIVAALKNKRMKTDNSTEQETLAKPDAKPVVLSSKFKPIGAPKAKAKTAAEVKLKKKTNVAPVPEIQASTSIQTTVPAPSTSRTAPTPTASALAEPEDDVDPDADLFAEAGDYDAFGDEDEDEDEGASGPSNPRRLSPPADVPAPAKWFKMDEDHEPAAVSRPPEASGHKKSLATRSRSVSPTADLPSSSRLVPAEEPPEPQQLQRLEGLSSSWSVQDVLSHNTYLEKEDKRLARKARNNRGGEEGKAALEREKERARDKQGKGGRAHQDWQKLQAYERKKGKE
ncbi:hypothetical protein BKA62DRAFT_734615 [Auriculariales sp. MPI-PUGE-AT-0066]|nr:hypothetical protein BKA62DRAFT_734615 [Auriculariales sp. MPI-PUGE-AT-0066]